MRELVAWIVTAALALGWLMDRNASVAESEPVLPPASPQVFALDALWAQHEDAQQPWLAFLDEPALQAGLYALPTGGTDQQPPHENDEIYFVLEGSATAAVGEEEVPVQPGSILYVKAQTPHRFHTITADLKLLVVFAKAGARP